MNTVHRQPKKQRTIKYIPSFVNKGDELVSDLDATKMFHDAGQDIGNSMLYKAYRNDLLSAYVINSKRYYIKSEITEAIKSFPRDMPRRDGYYPCRAKLNAEVSRLKAQMEIVKAHPCRAQLTEEVKRLTAELERMKQHYTQPYKYISIA